LVRSPNEEEFAKYERAIVAKMNSLVRTVNAETRKHYEELRVRRGLGHRGTDQGATSIS
jgi:hypothetical protein